MLKDVKGVTLIRPDEQRSNEPISKHVAAVWIDDEGGPPSISGMWLNGEDGRTVVYEGDKANPNIEPACFPLLFLWGKILINRKN